ncbi:MAG: polysaccharide biosynthesis tyrosine autokinase [Propionibacteriaceae bacterium]|nr:polysaccharide biosynthesis tyrosine autokinase [Propionibacteriaceae bacterium]
MTRAGDTDNVGEDVPLRDVLRILGRHWRTLLTCVLLVISATLLVSLSTTPVYAASTRVFLSSTASGYVVSKDDLGTYVELLGSPTLLDPLRQGLGLPADAPINITATVSERAPILSITARASSAKLATDIANAVAPQLAVIGGKYSGLIASTGGTVEATPVVPASTPVAPESPDVPRNVALGLLAGLALGIGFVLLRHFLDTRIRSEADLAALSPKPLLGSLRRIKNADRGALVMMTDPHGTAAEEFRRLRTNVQFVDVTTGGKHSFVVSSAIPGDGKTTTAVNLAIAMADSGAKVLLVDADLRNPSVARAMGLEGEVGLTTILLGRATVHDVAQRWGDTSMFRASGRAIPPNPSELLGSDAFADLIKQLLAAFDFVVVDSAPVLPVIDPVLISRLVGGMLLVVSAGRSKKHDVAAALKSLKTVDVEIAGFALNLTAGEGTYYGYGRRDAKDTDAVTNDQPARRSPKRARKLAA